MKAAAVVCRFCDYDFEAGAAPPPDGPQSSFAGIGCLITIALAGLLIASMPDQREDVASEAVPQARDPAPCDALLAEGERAGLIRERPSTRRINVEERLWAELPATAKRGTMAALLCSHLDGRPPTQLDDYAVAYGYRSGRRLAMVSEVGTRFE